ncbi:putative phosphoserine phosphatase [Helianthus anomalus]
MLSKAHGALKAHRSHPDENDELHGSPRTPVFTAPVCCLAIAGKVVAEWTARAKGGSVPVEEALATRLDLFKPSPSIVQFYLEKQPPRLFSGIKLGGYLISEGFCQTINVSL